jgi:HAMP domain-containing protein
MILKALSERHSEDLFLSEVKSGATMTARPGELRRFDGLAIKKSWSKPCVTIYEVKVSRNDFLRDDKWPIYRDYCHRLYFACPIGLIQKEELAPDVGLVWYNSETKRVATRKAATYRDIELPTSMLYYILLSRTESDRHPFFRGSAEFWQAWLEEKESLRSLGERVSNKMIKKLRKADETAAEMERLEKRFNEQRKELSQIFETLKQHDIPTWNIERTVNELDKALSGGINPSIIRLVQALAYNAQQLQSVICSKEEANA